MNVLNELRQLYSFIQSRNLQDSLNLVEVINDYLTEQLEPFPYFRNSQENLPDSCIKELDTFYVNTYEITKLLFCIQKNDIRNDEYGHLEIHFLNEAEELLANLI
jgi:hypothetical protein